MEDNSIAKMQKTGDVRRTDKYIPEELWTEVFHRIPPRRVLLLKFLSKDFYKAVSSDIDFAISNFHHHNTILCSKEEHGFKKEDYDEEEYEFDPLTEPITRIILISRHNTAGRGVLNGRTLSYVNRSNHPLKVSRTFQLPIVLNGSYKCEVVGNVNGLLLLHQFKSLYKKWNPCNSLTLVNPLTQKGFAVPKSPFSMITMKAKQVEVGFGYDHINDDYKIVVYILKPKLQNNGFEKDAQTANNDPIVEIFSLRTKSWRHQRVSKVAGNFCLGPKVYFNGGIHWVVGRVLNYDDDDYMDDYGRGNFFRLMSFNLGTEAFNYRNLPIQTRNLLNVPTVHGGSLCVISIKNRKTTIWRRNIEEDNWSYVKGHKYDNTELHEELEVDLIRSALYMVSEDCESVLFHLQDGRFFSFFFDEDAIEKHGSGLILMDTFVESLLSPLYPFARRITRN